MPRRQMADWFLNPEEREAAAAGGEGGRLLVCRAKNLFDPGAQDVKHGYTRKGWGEVGGMKRG